ncbi:MAG TPA: ferritin-like domain-containing protein [Pyrinomonadaceae bacterium]
MESFQRPELKQRAPEFKAADMTALQALAQAAINVELFTIPLYMISLFSIQGMHQITSSGNDFYQGRLWPGAAPSPHPEKDPDNQTNALAFNHFFSVFIDEMLHLQLASNVAKALGVMPTYNSSALQDTNYGWTCYGPDKTVIPHILDFRDTIEGYYDIKVKLDALTLDQNRLFLAIEENEDDAKSIIDPQKIGNYFPSVPFANWSADNTETDLPLFGTIGWMYKCLWQYMEIVYTDGTSLFESVFNRGTLERDLFNARSSYHKPEYPKMPTMASGEISVPDAMENILNMINAITDQGEGSGVAEWIRRMRGQLQYAPVKEQFRPDEAALNFDYPNYTDKGAQDNPSGDTVARSSNGGLDHHDRFLAINELLKTDKVVTWDQWHASGNSWTAEMLKTSSYDQNKWPLPPAEDVAAALNNLKGDANNYDIFSQVATGSIAGITRVLSGFWTDEQTSFPSPSMYGSGDRVSICWAIFGQYPDISKGIVDKTQGTLYHACQALDLDDPGNSCAPVAVFHSCRGSNDCKAEGGCGFVQIVGEDKIICGTKVLKDNLKPTHPLQKILKLYSAPSDNTCAGFGGCAIPISASQLYPAPDSANPKQAGTMEVYDLEPSTPVKLGTLSYSLGDKVYDVAWNAYIEVLKSHKVSPLPEKPKVDSDLRLAFPPST